MTTNDTLTTTDENLTDAYDGPANVDEIALHLMNYAPEVPAVVAVFRAGALAYEQPIDAIANETITMFIAEGRMVTYCLSVDIYPALFWEIVEKHARHAVDPQLGRTVSH